ncbi:MAG: TlpA disulfide reductase family protein [Bacteroidota bacterium]
MKLVFQFLFVVFVLPQVFSSCSGGAVEGFLLEGDITNSTGQNVLLDRVTIGQPNNMLVSQPIEGDQFEIAFPDGLESGTYLLRIGAQRAYIITDGEEHVKISGDVTDLSKYTFSVEGSPATADMAGVMSNLLGNGRPSMDDVEAIVNEASDPRIGAVVSYNLLRNSPSPQSLAVLETALEKLPELDPNHNGMSQYVTQLGALVRQQQAQELIQPGQPAPDIALSSPDGRTYRLSDLKGQVVLLDFWASWCGPCRRENPNVVDVYNRYKDQGFTVYSVSLDGPDLRRNPNMSADQIESQKASSKNRWVNAIQQDRLAWPYHVSELVKWDSEAAATYGVRGIPKTFMIDRDGNIAEVGLRGAASIEAALQNLL